MVVGPRRKLDRLCGQLRRGIVELVTHALVSAQQHTKIRGTDVLYPQIDLAWLAYPCVIMFEHASTIYLRMYLQMYTFLNVLVDGGHFFLIDSFPTITAPIIAGRLLTDHGHYQHFVERKSQEYNSVPGTCFVPSAAVFMRPLCPAIHRGRETRLSPCMKAALRPHSW